MTRILAIRDRDPFCQPPPTWLFTSSWRSVFPGALVVTLAGRAIFGLVEGTIWPPSLLIGATRPSWQPLPLQDLVAPTFQSRLDQVNAGSVTATGGSICSASDLSPPSVLPHQPRPSGNSFPVGMFYGVSQMGCFRRRSSTSTRDPDRQPSACPDHVALVIGSAGAARRAAGRARLVTRRFHAARMSRPGRSRAGSTGIWSSSRRKRGGQRWWRQVGASVTLIEANEMGGDCLNTGCVPSKAIIHAARLVAQARAASRMGLLGPAGDVDAARRCVCAVLHCGRGAAGFHRTLSRSGRRCPARTRDDHISLDG